jgi:hypothetical protein
MASTGVILKPAGSTSGAPAAADSMSSNGQIPQAMVPSAGKIEHFRAGPDSLPCCAACAEAQLRLESLDGGETLKLSISGMGARIHVFNSQRETLLTAVRPSMMSRQFKILDPAQIEVGSININMLSFDIFLNGHQHRGTLSGMRSLVIKDEMHQVVFKASAAFTSMNVEANTGVFPPAVICLICAIIAS